MDKSQIKVIAQIIEKENNFTSCRQIPMFFVTAYCFATAKSIVKDMFKNQDISGGLMDIEGNLERF